MSKCDILDYMGKEVDSMQKKVIAYLSNIKLKNMKRDPRRDPQPGDVWRIADIEGIVLRVEVGKVIVNPARFRDGRWREANMQEIGAAALWEVAMTTDYFFEVTENGQLIQCAEGIFLGVDKSKVL